MRLDRRLLGATLAAVVVVAMAGSSSSSAASRAEVMRRERLAAPLERLKRNARPLGYPAPNDWLRSHPETGQTLAEFVAARPAPLAPPHDTIDVVPIGGFTRAQSRILESTVDYLERFFGSPIRVLPIIPLSAIPDSALRFREDLGWSQMSSFYVLERLLSDRHDSRSYTTIALTAVDLFPEPSWNFVFGLASPENRSGVWSMFRFGDPGESAEAERACLLRTIKTASHEIGHMLSIQHCIAYECVMNGSNHLEELDRRPTDLCPPCEADRVRVDRSHPPREAPRRVPCGARPSGGRKGEPPDDRVAGGATPSEVSGRLRATAPPALP